MVGAFVEVYVHATIEELSTNRDPKGLYKKALAGEIKGFTGVDDPYEVPEHPELILDTMVESPDESLQRTLTRLKELGYLDEDTIVVAGRRLHSGMTDLRVHDTGHVVEEH
jgi:adenylylsulfate kinase-like enzyme